MTDKWLLDTNIVLYFLKGNKTVRQLLDGHLCYVSFVTEIELLSFARIMESESNLLREFLNDVAILEYTSELKPIIIDLRIKHRLKLADAIIASTALFYNTPFISADYIFERIDSPSFYIYHPTKGEMDSM